MEKSSQAQTGKDGEDNDLKTLLSSEQREDFSLLIVTITEEMKQQTRDIFDASFSAPKNPDDPRLHHGNPNISPSERKSPRAGLEEEERQERLKREKEVSAPEIQQTKRDILTHLEKWQKTVLKRVAEVLDTKTQEQRHEAKHEAEAQEPLKRPDYKVVGMSEVFKSKDNIQHREQEEDEQVEADEALIRLYPPTPTPLLGLRTKQRILVLNSTLLLLLSLEHYEAQSRVLLLNMASSLHLPLSTLTKLEKEVAATLLEAAKKMTGAEEAKKRGDENQTSRRWKVGLAGIAGAALIGITGGLAAPLIAAGIGTVMGGLGLGATAAAGLLGTLAQSGVIVGALFGAYGGKMTGEMMDQYAKEVEDFAFLPLHGHVIKERRTGKTKESEISVEDRRLRVSIGISGWLTQKEDVVSPWRSLGRDTEVFALRWELDALMNLGTSMESVLKSYAWGVAKKEIIQRTIFGALSAALWPLSFLKFGKVLDNPFSIAKNRADKAGQVLADALINRAQGERPVVLVGYSLGARVIYACLQQLAERKAFGLVESAVLIGSPCPSEARFWRMMKSVVSGRLVNVYSENDYVLGFLYRTSSIQLGIAGLQAIDVSGVENVDVSELVSGHLRYQYLTGCILKRIGWEDVDEVEIEREAETIRLMDQEEEREAVEAAEREMDKKAEKTGGEKEELLTFDDDNMRGAQEVRDDDLEWRPNLPERKTSAGETNEKEVTQDRNEKSMADEMRPTQPPRPYQGQRGQKWKDTRTEAEKLEEPLEQMHF